jgi:hypothetical protein
LVFCLFLINYLLVCGGKKTDLEYPDCLSGKKLLTAGFSGIVALATIYRSTGFRFERNLCTFTALCAGGREQPAFRLETALLGLVTAAIHLAGFSGLTAGRAALGGMVMAYGLKSLLVFHAENEAGAAIEAVN